MEKPAPAEHPIHELIANRWSPRAFADRPVPRDLIKVLFEAARWAPSCFNAQPWSFVIAHKADEAGYTRILDLLVEGNQAWAKGAPVLMISFADPFFDEAMERPNAHAWHDVGLASAMLATQATALGLRVHFMAGFDRKRAPGELGAPEHFEAVAAAALGYPGDPDSLEERFAERERAARERRPQSAFVHEGRFK